MVVYDIKSDQGTRSRDRATGDFARCELSPVDAGVSVCGGVAVFSWFRADEELEFVCSQAKTLTGRFCVL